MTDPLQLPAPRSRRRSRRRILLFVALAIAVIATAIWWFSIPVSAGPAEGSAFIGAATTRPSARTLRIGTFNIDSGRGTDGVVNLGRTAASLQRLDFIALNEVRAQDVFGGGPAQATELAERLKLPYLFAPAERRFGREHFGNALFTHLPVTHWKRVVLPSLRFKACRNYVLTDVDWNGSAIHFLTTHTDWKKGGAEQLRIVIDEFLHLPEPAVLMGDLNAPLSDPQIKQLLARPGVEEAIATVFSGIPAPGRVDWIFLRGLQTIDAGIVENTGASDHPAYWAEVKLQ